MRIGIDCRTILDPDRGERAGIGNYTYHLVKNIIGLDKKNRYVLFFQNQTAGREFKGENTEIIRFPFFRYKRYLPFVYPHLIVSKIISSKKLDVYHNPANIIPLFYHGKSIITVHDLAVFIEPDWFPKKLFWRQPLSTDILFPSSLNKAEKIIAVSENTKNDLINIFKVKPEKIRVVYEGAAFGKNTVPINEDLFRDKFKIRGEYILYLGTIEPRKNLEVLVEAFEKHFLIKNNNQVSLVIAGACGWKYQGVFEKIKTANLKYGGDPIKYLGYVSESDKISLLENCAVFAFPSLYEGFGLPIVEAMSLGAPVVTSNLSSLTEVAGTAGILINPRNSKELGSALERIIQNSVLKNSLKEKSLEQAKKFSFGKMAGEIIRIYEEVNG